MSFYDYCTRPDREYPRCVMKNDCWTFVCKCDDVETAQRIAQALNLFSYIQDHEASDGVIARRLLWAKEAERVLEELLRVDDEWHGSVNSEMAAARQRARAALAKAKGE